MGKDETKLSFLRTSLRFYSALANLEPQIYVVVEQFGAENISLVSGCLVSIFDAHEHFRDNVFSRKKTR